MYRGWSSYAILCCALRGCASSSISFLHIQLRSLNTYLYHRDSCSQKYNVSSRSVNGYFVACSLVPVLYFVRALSDKVYPSERGEVRNLGRPPLNISTGTAKTQATKHERKSIKSALSPHLCSICQQNATITSRNHRPYFALLARQY